jgi:hypothetical protein
MEFKKKEERHKKENTGEILPCDQSEWGVAGG